MRPTRELTLQTPYDDILKNPVTTDVEVLPSGALVVGEVVGANVLMPGDVVTADDDGIITGISRPSQYHAWEFVFSPEWANTLKLDALAERLQHEYSVAEVVDVHLSTTISMTVISDDVAFMRDLAAWPEVEHAEPVRAPAAALDLQELLASRYPRNDISMEEFEHQEWMRKTDDDDD